MKQEQDNAQRPPVSAVFGRYQSLRGRFIMVGIALMVAACGPVRVAPLPGPIPEIRVLMRDFRFTYPMQIPSGPVVFRILNAGSVPHRLALLPLTEDVPPIKVQLKGTNRRSIRPFAGIPTRATGERGVFAVNLVPGQRYAFVCFERDPGGSTFASRGMGSEFRAEQSH